VTLVPDAACDERELLSLKKLLDLSEGKRLLLSPGFVDRHFFEADSPHWSDVYQL